MSGEQGLGSVLQQRQGRAGRGVLRRHVAAPRGQEGRAACIQLACAHLKKKPQAAPVSGSLRQVVAVGGSGAGGGEAGSAAASGTQCPHVFSHCMLMKTVRKPADSG